MNRKYRESENLQKTFIIDDGNGTRCKRIILVLDESGSMSNQKTDIIGGINEMIRQQRKLEPETNSDVYFNIVKFNGVVKSMPTKTLASIEDFSSRDYCPSGSTALYDAIGKTISKFKNERDVIMVIATDGQENSSREYNHSEVVRMISEQKEFREWDFVYLSEDLDTFEQGNSFGIYDGTKGAYNQCVGKSKLGRCMQTEMYNCQISNLRQKKAANFSGLSSVSGTSSSSAPTPFSQSFNPQTQRSFRPKNRKYPLYTNNVSIKRTVW